MKTRKACFVQAVRMYEAGIKIINSTTALKKTAGLVMAAVIAAGLFILIYSANGSLCYFANCHVIHWRVMKPGTYITIIPLQRI